MDLSTLDHHNLRRIFADYQPRPLAEHAEGPVLKPAGVLVPLVNRSEGWTVILTQRTSDLTHHAGQISFPGGRVDADDASPLAAALREAEEEIALQPSRVETIGELDQYRTITRYRITPVIGLIEDPGPLKADPSEVAEIFEVPLPFFLDAANFERHDRVVDGRHRAFYAVPYDGRFIWGATAAMLRNLCTVVGSAS
ncbi:MAG: CoA pyrophosphatase [Alphaproteobacteria bacterium]|nr:CoA pyrophosphatase [Alphaproteobacteria bacterium SS10]